MGTHSQTSANLAIYLWNCMVPTPQNICVGGTPTMSCELEDRQRISNDNRFQRLEIGSIIFQNPCSEMWTFAGRSLCLACNFPITTVFELQTRSSWHCHRCILNKLGGHMGGILFPPFALIGRCLQQVMTQNVDRLTV